MGRKTRPKRNSQVGKKTRRPARPPAYRMPSQKDMVPSVGRCYHLGRVKLQFRTDKVAQEALAQAQARRRLEGETHIEQRTYRCPKCNFWHLTSQPQRSENA